MYGMLFATAMGLFATAMGLLAPAGLLAGSFIRKQLQPFLLGVIAFVVSQVMIRLPALSYLTHHSSSFAMLSVLHPYLYAVFLGLTAALVEEFARYGAMRLLMRKKEWQSGIFFGAGHGGVEALLLLGLPVANLLLSSESLASGGLYAVGGIERGFAILLHMGLSILVLQTVVKKKWRFLVVAIAIHTGVDALAGMLPLIVPLELQLLVTELFVAVTAIVLFGWCMIQKRKDGWT